MLQAWLKRSSCSFFKLYEVLVLPWYVCLYLRSDDVCECLTMYSLISSVFGKDFYSGVYIVHLHSCSPLLHCLLCKALGNKPVQLLYFCAFDLFLFVIVRVKCAVCHYSVYQAGTLTLIIIFPPPFILSWYSTRAPDTWVISGYSEANTHCHICLTRLYIEIPNG